METVDSVLWDVYFPQLVERWTAPLIFDTEDDRKFKAALKTKMLAASKDEIQQMLADVAKAERRAEYEALKQEFGE